VSTERSSNLIMIFVVVITAAGNVFLWVSVTVTYSHSIFVSCKWRLISKQEN
jgi:hypothetical protein